MLSTDVRCAPRLQRHKRHAILDGFERNKQTFTMGKGKELFGHYNDLAKEKGPGTKESAYAGILFQALLMVGERRTFELLEEADEQGKKLKLQYPDSSKKGEAPSGIVLE
ncbi:hypothetical protein [Dyadobacter sp. CY343]|uniref:hypothetical protein n=1 Tax=Dyadobacter sp. CY343 TaxID=2907299 RepID=UPI001F1E7942|nr:hypothetical protein [Dyadobacter sp. CY343]MCE7060876.1 hypothetical protein [Dyadobacter sp. CY343]